MARASQATDHLQCRSTNYKSGRAIGRGVQVRAQACTGSNQACQPARAGELLHTAIATYKQRLLTFGHILKEAASESLSTEF